MALSYSVLTPENADGLISILPAAWSRNWDPGYLRAFFAWRYLERPDGETILALDGERCVAFVDSFRRPYRLGGETVMVRETCDWFCLPEYRSVGAGLRVMQRAMARGEPILSTGGTEATLELLPRLGWKRLPDAENFILPITVGATAALVLRDRFGERAEQLAKVLRRLPIRLPRRRRETRSGPHAEVRVLAPDEVRLPSPCPEPGASSLFRDDEARWLANAPKEVGTFLWLGFLLDGNTVGISCSRVEPGPGRPTARILHLQASDLSPPIAGWMAAATLKKLVDLGSGLVRARFSHPELSAALTGLGFLRRSPSAVLWWPAGGVTPEGPMHLALHRADDGLLPFPA